MYLMGVFKKNSKPRVNNKRGPSKSNTDPSTMNLVDVPGFIDGTQPVLLGSGRRSMLDTFETSYDSNLYESIIKQLNEQSYIELNKGKDGSYFIRGFGVNADSSIEVKNVVLDKNILKFEQLQNEEDDIWINYTLTSNPNKVTLNDKTYMSKYVYYPDKGTVIVYLVLDEQAHPFMTLSDTLFR